MPSAIRIGYYPLVSKERTYLVRGPDGRMATIVARSNRGALDRYIPGRGLKKGDPVSIKERGVDEPWTEYKITR